MDIFIYLFIINITLKGKEAAFGLVLVTVCDIFVVIVVVTVVFPKAEFVKASQRYCDKPRTL